MPRLVVDGITLAPDEAPLPDLPGNRLDKYGNGYWDFPSQDDVPLEFGPIVGLIERRRGGSSPAR